MREGTCYCGQCRVAGSSTAYPPHGRQPLPWGFFVRPAGKDCRGHGRNRRARSGGSDQSLALRPLRMDNGLRTYDRRPPAQPGRRVAETYYDYLDGRLSFRSKQNITRKRTPSSRRLPAGSRSSRSVATWTWTRMTASCAKFAVPKAKNRTPDGLGTPPHRPELPNRR